MRGINLATPPSEVFLSLKNKWCLTRVRHHYCGLIASFTKANEPPLLVVEEDLETGDAGLVSPIRNMNLLHPSRGLGSPGLLLKEQ